MARCTFSIVLLLSASATGACSVDRHGLAAEQPDGGRDAAFDGTVPEPPEAGRDATDDAAPPDAGMDAGPCAGGCDDGDRCTDDLCGVAGCEHVDVCIECVSSSDCSDPVAGPWSDCTGFDGQCDATGVHERMVTTYGCVGGSCVPVMSSETAGCMRVVEGQPCNDGDGCAPDRCADSVCVSACDDGDRCTEDRCNPGGRCLHHRINGCSAA